MSKINKRKSSKKETKKTIDKKTSSEDADKVIAKQHELEITRKKWDEERITDNKSTFGVRLPESVQFEIKRAAKLSDSSSISEYVANIHDVSLRKENSILVFAHDPNRVVRLLKLALLCPRALSLYEKDEFALISYFHKFWIDPKFPENKIGRIGERATLLNQRVQDTIPRMFTIIKNFNTIQTFISKNRRSINFTYMMPRMGYQKRQENKISTREAIYGSTREAIYGKKHREDRRPNVWWRTGSLDESYPISTNEDENKDGFGLNLDFQLTKFEQDIEDKYIKIFKILHKLKHIYRKTSTAPNQETIHEFEFRHSEAYVELNKLLESGFRAAKEHDPNQDHGDDSEIIDWDDFEDYK